MSHRHIHANIYIYGHHTHLQHMFIILAYESKTVGAGVCGIPLSALFSFGSAMNNIFPRENNLLYL